MALLWILCMIHYPILSDSYVVIHNARVGQSKATTEVLLILLDFK
jgi:hypothetical protein